MSLEVGQEELGSRAEGLVRRSCGRRNGRGQAHGRRGGGRRQPKTRRRPTAAAGPSEAPNPVSAASRFGERGDGGDGGGDVGWWQHRPRGFGRSRRRIPAGWSSGGRTGARGKGSGGWAFGVAAGFGADAPRDVNLHHEVLYFTSRGGRSPIFFAYGPSVGAAFFDPDGPKVRYFYI